MTSFFLFLSLSLARPPKPTYAGFEEAVARTPTLDGNERIKLFFPSNAFNRQASCAHDATERQRL